MGAALLLIVGGTTAAFADQVIVDGDGVAPVAGPTGQAAKVSACTDKPVQFTVLLAARGNGGANNRFADGSTVEVFFTSAQASMTVSPEASSISIPSDWSSNTQNRISVDTVPVVVSLPAQADAGSGTVTFGFTGETSNTALVKGEAVVTVNWTTKKCILDDTAPVLSLPPTITIEATSAAGATVTYPATATDETAPAAPPVTCTPASTSTFPLGTTPVSCSATDAAGNTRNGSFDVVVRDTTAPAVGSMTDITMEAHGPETAVSWTNPVATDAVAGSPAVSCAPASGSLFPVGSTLITCSATDAAGNTGTATFTVTVTDTTAPSMVLPEEITVEATSPAGAPVVYATSAFDAVDGDLAVECEPASGATLALGDTTIDCSATDAEGNTTSASFVVHVVDTIAPDVTVPAGITTEATGPGGAVVTFPASAQDAVSGELAPSCVPASGSTFTLGTTKVVCTATDSADNDGTGTFTVTVVDTTLPELTLPGTITAEATGSGGAVVTYDATATDVVSGLLPAECAPASGATFALGSHQVNCTVTDGAGNTAAGSFAVYVVDTTAPAIDVPETIVREATGPAGAVAEYAVTASDVVDGAVEVTCVPVSGGTFPLGTTSVECDATDAAGNAGHASFDVLVRDTTAPVIDVPETIVREATGPSGAVAEYSVTASDVVDGAVEVTCVPVSGATFPLGTTSVECDATDAAGNAGHASFDVLVRDTTAPVITWIGGPQPGGSYVFGSVPAAGSCTAVDLVDPTVACSVSGFGTTVGAHTLTATASDDNGNTATDTRSYSVTAWTLRGFFQPVDMSGVWNSVKGGATVPLKFEVFAGSTELTAVSAVSGFTVKGVACPGSTVATDDIELTTTGGTSLRYDATAGQFIQNWQTPKKPGSCYQVIMTTQDGSTTSALFKLK